MMRIVRAIIYGLDPRPVELLTAQMSLWFAVVLATRDSPTSPQPNWLWALWCGAAAVLKVAGVVSTLGGDPAPRWSPWARAIGCLLGLFFWAVLATVFYFLAPHGITWGGFLIVALAQSWSLYRLARRGA